MKFLAYLLYALICITCADKSAPPRKGNSSNLRGNLFQSLLKDHPALLEKLNANPDVVQFLQTHPELAEKVKADPSVLDRFLAARDARNAGKAVDKESKKNPTVLKDDKKKSKKDPIEKEDKKATKKDKGNNIDSTMEDLLAKDDTTEQSGASDNSITVSTEDADEAVDYDSKKTPTVLKDDKKKSKKDPSEKENKKATKKDKGNNIESTMEDLLAKDDTTEQSGASDNSITVSTEDAGEAVDYDSKKTPIVLKDDKKKSKKDPSEKEDKKGAKKDKEHSRKSKTEDSIDKDDTTELGGVSTEDASTATASSKVEPESRRLDAKDKALDFVMSHPDMASFRATSTSHHPRSSPKVDDSFMMARPVIVAAPKSHQDLVDKVRMHPEIMQRLTIDKLINEKIIH